MPRASSKCSVYCTSKKYALCKNVRVDLSGDKQSKAEVGKLPPAKAFCAARRAVTRTWIAHIWSVC